MERLQLTASRATPMVDFDPQTSRLIMKGQSYPENAFKFYDPVFQWLEQYLSNCKGPLSVELNLPYVNTSSSKCIMMFLEQLEHAHLKGLAVTLTWYYDPENESELECAEEFKEDVTFGFHLAPTLEHA